MTIFIYSQVHTFLDNEMVFIILALYATRIELKWKNQNEYFVKNHLQAMTALGLELMDITRDWVSSFVMLCQVFTAADFSCCLLVGISAFVISKWNAC